MNERDERDETHDAAQLAQLADMPTAECGQCARVQSEAADVIEAAEMRAAMWQGIGIGAWIIAALAVGVVIALWRMSLVADEQAAAYQSGRESGG